MYIGKGSRRDEGRQWHRGDAEDGGQEPHRDTAMRTQRSVFHKGLALLGIRQTLPPFGVVMSQQRTFVILKPDAVQRGLVGEILARFERKGLQIVAMKFITATTAQASQHYQEHREKPFYAGLVQFITSSPMVILVLDGDEA